MKRECIPASRSQISHAMARKSALASDYSWKTLVLGQWLERLIIQKPRVKSTKFFKGYLLRSRNTPSHDHRKLERKKFFISLIESLKVLVHPPRASHGILQIFLSHASYIHSLELRTFIYCPTNLAYFAPFAKTRTRTITRLDWSIIITSPKEPVPELAMAIDDCWDSGS